MKKMTMKYSGKCSVCGSVINRGTEVAFKMSISSDKKRMAVLLQQSMF